MTLRTDRQTCNIKRACELAGIARRTLYYWMQSGKVEYLTTASGSRRRIFIDTLLRDGNVTVAEALAPALKPFPQGPLVPPLLRSRMAMAKMGIEQP